MNKFKFLNKNDLSKLPQSAGVYSFWNKKKLLYIGKAGHIKERVKNHFQSVQPEYKTAVFRDTLFMNKVTKVGYIKTNSEIEAFILEANLIKKHQPRYNVMWRDDKNYFYAGMSKEDYPRIYITHQPKKSMEIVGPFIDGKALKESLKFLRKIFPHRSCRHIPKGACLWYHLNMCPAPCIQGSGVSEVWQIKKKLKKEAQKDANSLFNILKGNKTLVLRGLEKEMKSASKNREFEKAAKLRDKILVLKKIITNARIFSPQITTPPDEWEKTGTNLGRIIDLKKNISKIEAYDISNIQGREATGSMVAFVDGKPFKDFYRKFKINQRADGTPKPDDTAMLKEILERRLKHKEWKYPDVILIDGGKPQINTAINLKSSVPGIRAIKILAIAKRKNELYVEGKSKPILLKTLPREIFNLILQLRDEAHRFAISYHKKLRRNKIVS